MASSGRSTLDDSRRGMGSPKPKGRGELSFGGGWCLFCSGCLYRCANSRLPVENAKDTLCRNVTIYGRCRYEDKGALRNPSSPSTLSYCRLSQVRYCEYNLTMAKGCAFNHDPHKMNPTNNSDRLEYPGKPLGFVDVSIRGLSG